MGQETGEFSLIVTAVEPGKTAEAAKAFASTFSLDDMIAQQICKSAPIIFAQKLTKIEVKAISPKLAELSASGIEFRVTARVTGRIPKVNWPVRPQFTAGDSGSPAGLAFDWESTAFVCPGCGESFLFKRMGKLPLVEEGSAPAPSAPRMTAPAPAPAPRYSPPPPTTKPAPVMAAAPKSPELGFADDSAPPQIESLGSAPPFKAKAGAAATDDLSMGLAPEEAPESLDAPVPTAELEPLEEVAPEPPPVEEAPPQIEEEAPVSAPVAEIAPEPEADAEGGEIYNVFLSKITDNSKRDKSAELIAKIKGCSLSEAKELTTRLVIPLAKNAPKAKAEDILGQFKKLKIFGRMTKVK